MLFFVAACGNSVSETKHDADESNIGVSTQALWANGDFESDALNATPPTSWAVNTYTNPTGVTGSSTSPPASFAALNLSSSGGKLETYVVGGSAESQIDPDLGSGQAFRFPRFGTRGARVNYKDTTDDGHNKNANSLSQSMTISSSDIDPLDGNVHVRFAVAPVLENPSHGYTQQPFYFIELLNVTRGTTLYRDFNTAGQSGVPWITTTSIRTGNTTQWTNWQLVDLSPGAAVLGIGDQVKLTVVGSGCALGGHFGRVYVDGTGASVPGLYTWATGPSSAAAGANITYTIYYSNGGASTATGVHIDMATPPQTTYQSLSGPSNCTTPGGGQTGTISCPLGVLAPSSSGSFTVTVKINSTATGSVVNGNYSIAAINNSALLGARVTTTVTSSTTKYADAQVTQTANVTSANWGDTITYTITLKNNGPNGLNKTSTSQLAFSDIFPAQLTNISWTCAATGSQTSCPSGSGTGSISNHPKVGNGGNIKYTVSATIISGSGLGSVTNTATATVTGSRNDPDTSNNSAALTLSIGTPRTLTITKVTPASGTVSTAPAGISCGTGCTTANATFANGTVVTLTATPIPGATFGSWSGACSGTTPTCSLTMSADKSATATFNAAPTTGSAANIYAYAGSNQLARTSNAFASPLTTLVTDSNGNPVNNVTVTYTAVPVGGASATLAGATKSNSSGISTVNPTANGTAGTYTVTASISLGGGNTATTTFTLINVGAASSIAYVSGGTATDPNQAPVSSAFLAPLMVLVTDSASHPVPGVTVNFTKPGSGASATLSSASAVTDTDGHASVTATANATAGSYVATATLTGVGAINFTMQNVASTPATVFVVSGDGQDTPTSSQFDDDLVVGVTDSLGNALSNVTVTFTAPGSGASLKFSNNTATITATTDASGLATVTAPTANSTVGTYGVSATVSGVATPATFTLTNDGPQVVDVQSGAPQSAKVNTAFASLVALVTDSSSGLPISGVTVTFAAPGSGATATLVPSSAVTNASGFATIGATAGTVAGSYNVTATTAQAGAPANFALTNTAGTAFAIAVNSGNSQHATVSSAFASPLVAKVTDSFANPVSGAAVTFAPPGSGATAAISGSPATTDASGLASVTATANATTGSYSVSASISGGASTTFSLTNDPPAGCTTDAQCASTEFCNTASTTCTPKLVNGTAIPTITGHTPVLTGVCLASVGTAVCASGVCDTADNKCGYANTHGPCDATSAPTVCRSSTCSVSNLCMAPGGCLAAGDCNLANATPACSAGACTISTCNTGFANCDGSAVNGCEQVTSNDVNNCGSCGHVCSLSHASAACASGSCTVSTCNSGYGDCDGSPGNGCELQTSGSDVNNCGGCGSICSEANASAACTSGSCGIGTCNSGYADCNTSPGDGCELQTGGSDVNNCGGCGVTCSPAHASGACTSGSCGVGTCTLGYANCNGSAGDGCEVLIAGSDVNNCGGCATVCSPTHAIGACAGGSCGIATCGFGYSDCNASAVDGCEVLTGGSDLGNCGGCGTICSPAHASGACTIGSCGIGSCGAGYSDCNNNASDGCEVLTGGSDLGNCGGCGSACSPAHATGLCTSGSCGINTCSAGYSNCNGSATDGCEVLTGGSDLGNCGGCGSVCSPAHASGACTAGSCGIGSCDAGYADCDNNPSNGCEVLIAGSDLNNCGGCGTVCGRANATPACTAGSCAIATCNTGYANCDSSDPNGCEVHTDADATHCGSCGNVCTLANATAGCSAAACTVVTCDSGYSNCDSNAANGCELLTGGSDRTNCGGCGTTCSTSDYCVTGACTPKKPNSQTCASADECSSGICDSDNKCGLPDGKSCATSSVCRGGACSVASVCIQTNGCAVDGDCLSDQFCDTSLHECSAKLPNGTPIPTIAGHDPALTGACTLSVGGVVCASAVCDTADSECGYRNGDGPCTSGDAALVCRSSVCGSDALCGYPDGEGSCTSGNAATVCRSGLCHNGVCSPPPQCTVDGDCSSDRFCDTAAQACTPKLPNGTPIPTIDEHTPPLDGSCTSAVGMIVCSAAVCEPSDDRCGYLNGDGPCDNASAATVCRSGVCGGDAKCGFPSGEGNCTSTNAGTVCRSGLCSPNTHECVATIGCLADSDCLSTQFCDTGANDCTAKLVNGIDVPTIANHTPDLDGTCNVTVGHAVCSADVCDTNDDKCAYLNGDGPCDDDDAGAVCRSGVCGSDELCGYPDFEGNCTTINAATVCRGGLCSLTSHVCAPANGCVIDADCSSDDFCDTAIDQCVPKLPNDTSIPTIGGHDPALSGACTTSVGGAVCVAAVCDGNDDKCGYPNGRGTCNGGNAAVVCRSGACGGDAACGYRNGEGICDNSDAAVVCRSGLCSASHVCAAPPECAVDGDCDATRFCDTSTFTCTPKLPNSTPIPSIGGHDPALTGDCNASVGSAVCAAGVCDVGDDECGYPNAEGPCDGSSATALCRSGVCGSDDLCGYPNGEGSCDSLNASSVCRSGVCSPTTHQCAAPPACTQDSECQSTQFCDTVMNVCTAKLINGTDIPTIANHSPVLDGNCTSPVGSAVCSADVCDTADDKCGYLNADGPCDSSDAGAVCRSGVCGQDALCGYPNLEGPCTSIDAITVCRSGVCSASSHVCVEAGGCTVDRDCDKKTQFCNTASNRCVPKLPNGLKVPTIAKHTPVLTGACSVAVGKIVCATGVCDPSDDKCGYPNGEDSCSDANAGTVCRSGVCGNDDKCGYPDGEGSCSAKTAGTRCRSGLCSDASHVCIAPGGCAEDADCASTQFCDTSESECRTKLPDGTPIPKIGHHKPALSGACDTDVGKTVCRAGVCDAADDKCALANGDGACTNANASNVCRSNVCGSDGKCGYPDGEGSCTSMTAGTLCRSATCRDDTHTCGTTPNSGCMQDDECASTQFCDTAMHACVAKLDDGKSVPMIGGHTPALDGQCSADVGAAVCKAAVCDSSDDRCALANGDGPCQGDSAGTVCRSNVCGDDGKCGLPDGEGPCTSVNAASVCRSGMCAAGLCGPAHGCSSNADCAKRQYCDRASMECKDKRPGEAQCNSDAQCESHSCDLAAHRCNTCIGNQCGRLKLAGGGFGCNAVQPGSGSAAANYAFGALALLLLSLVRRSRRSSARA